MPQVQLRLPETVVKEIDKYVKEDRFRNRSDAIKTMIELYEERERTRNFLSMLLERKKEIEIKPKILISLDDIK